MIQARGYEAAYLWFGLGQGIVVILVALMLRAPRPGEAAAPVVAPVQQGSRDYAPADVLKSPPFWLMYAMFVMVGTGGLMVTAQFAPVARDFAIDHVPVSMLGLTMPAFTIAVQNAVDVRDLGIATSSIQFLRWRAIFPAAELKRLVSSNWVGAPAIYQ